MTKIVEQLEDELSKKETAAKEDEGCQGPAAIQLERESLMKRKSELITEVERLQAEKDVFEINNVASVRQKTEDISRWKLELVIWIDNIDIMEQYLSKLACGDRALVEAVRKQCYGDDYTDGDDIIKSQV